MKKRVKSILYTILITTIIISIFFISVYAETSKNNVIGKVYTFDKDSNYEISENKDYVSSDKTDTYGHFSVKGNVTNISTKNGIPSFEVVEGKLELSYTYSDTLLNADDNSWYLIEDKTNKFDGKKLSDKIMKGMILLQTSKDHINWTDVECKFNVFNDTPNQTESFYSTTDIQILNGCYYRLIVAYETRKKVEPSKFLFFKVDEYEYKKNAEVYEFYARSTNGDNETIPNETYSLGLKARTKEFDGYFGETEIVKDKDSHYGWDLGQFYVSGYTDKVINSDKDLVFLKNVGDKITLWFALKQNINKLNENSNLSITADKKGYDQYFETPMMDFGKGTLIIRYTDYNGNKSEPQIYVNYLEANASAGADTKVQVFEEGDYEVALDYEVTDNKLIDKVGHYRIFFKFQVRNGNCMIYPFDILNGNELTNSSMTENGFKLDLAKSRYLKINIKREILTDSADGLVEDTRFNGPAKDGEEYTTEGIYTITVSHEYTNILTTKRIYVGANKIIKAYMANEGLSIAEINKMLSKGASIDNDGIITLNANMKLAEPEQKPTVDTSVEQQNTTNGKEHLKFDFKWIIITMSILVIFSVALVFYNKNKIKKIISKDKISNKEDNVK